MRILAPLLLALTVTQALVVPYAPAVRRVGRFRPIAMAEPADGADEPLEGAPAVDAPAAPEIQAEAPADDDSGAKGGLDLIDGATLAFGVVVLLNILGLNPFGPKPPGQ